jgi:hypothetical protein
MVRDAVRRRQLHADSVIILQYPNGGEVVFDRRGNGMRHHQPSATFSAFIMTGAKMTEATRIS